MTVGILGGTGGFGQGLALRLQRLGEDVLVGSRSPRDDIVSNAEAASRSDLVVLSVPPGAVVSTARDRAAELDVNNLLTVASPVIFRVGRPAAEPSERSLAEIAPGASSPGSTQSRRARSAPKARSRRTSSSAATTPRRRP